jgi:predicted component of type VI protein secretion system
MRTRSCGLRTKGLYIVLGALLLVVLSACSSSKPVPLGTTLSLAFNGGPTLNVEVSQANVANELVTAVVSVQAPTGIETGDTIFALCGTAQDVNGKQFTGDINSQPASANKELALGPNQTQTGMVNVALDTTAVPPFDVVCQVGNAVGLWSIPS